MSVCIPRVCRYVYLGYVYLGYVYEFFWRNFCRSFWRILFLLPIASFRIGVPSILFLQNFNQTLNLYLNSKNLKFSLVWKKNIISKLSGQIIERSFHYWPPKAKQVQIFRYNFQLDDLSLILLFNVSLFISFTGNPAWRSLLPNYETVNRQQKSNVWRTRLGIDVVSLSFVQWMT